MYRAKIIILVLVTLGTTMLFEVTASAKKVTRLFEDMTVYKIRRGSTVSRDIILKSFTLHKNHALHTKYVPKEGGWEISTSTFHSGKYVYYFSLSNSWTTINDKEIYTQNSTPKTSWIRKGNSKAWVWSKPGAGHKKFNISNFKHTIWTVDHETQLMYNKKPIYLRITNKKNVGWIKSTSIKLAPHRSLMIKPIGDGIDPLSSKGKRSYTMSPKFAVSAIQFNNEPSKIWIYNTPTSTYGRFEMTNPYIGYVRSNQVTVVK